MKKRLDLFLVENGLASGRSRAERLIKDGQVLVNGSPAPKAGMQVDLNDTVEINAEMLRYVSRGGLKLERAINSFGLSLEGVTAVDIGASTGGFTDCMLQNGAKKVYAVDVGSGQLSPKLLADKRVINLENTNARYIGADVIPEKVDLISVDVSFISLRLVLPAAVSLLSENGRAVCLIKPQFEAGRENLGKRGVVKDKGVHEQVITSVCGIVRGLGLIPAGLDRSPVRGPEGNIEYLLYIVRPPADKIGSEDIRKTVEAAHAEL